MMSNPTQTPPIWPSILTAVLMIPLCLYAWQRRRVPGALPFAIASLFGMFWVGGSALQIAAIDFPTKILWFKFQGIMQLPTITAITIFLLEFAWPGRYLTRRNLTLLAIPCLLFLLMALTNESLQLAWRGFSYDGLVVPIRGPGNWISVAYGYVLALVNIAVFVWLFFHSPQNRWLVVLMLVSMVATRAAYLLDAVGRIQSILPVDVLLIAVPFMVYTIALLRFRILDPIPLARQMAIEQLDAGMLIVDPQGRIISLNPAGVDIFGKPAKQLLGCPVHSLLPECTGLVGSENPHLVDTKEIEINLESGSETRSYQLDCSALVDWRGLVVGLLILLHDITAHKQVQAKLMEQERVLATLKEREQVARELHDGLSQELAMINVQAQLVSGLLEVGEPEKAEEQLQLLAKAAREAQIDVRGQIGNLSLNIAPGEGFLGALHRFLEMFQQTYGIDTNLIAHDFPSTISLAPMVEVQLLRIVQEALTNIHKHAQADKVIMSLMRETDYLEFIIEDDGIGFDPGKSLIADHSFGLGIMSARAEDVGGSVTIHSSPGQGTRIVVVVPCSSEEI